MATSWADAVDTIRKAYGPKLREDIERVEQVMGAPRVKKHSKEPVCGVYLECHNCGHQDWRVVERADQLGTCERCGAWYEADDCVVLVGEEPPLAKLIKYGTLELLAREAYDKAVEESRRTSPHTQRRAWNVNCTGVDTSATITEDMLRRQFNNVRSCPY